MIDAYVLKMTGPVRVFLLDDHEIVRRGVADVLNAEADIEVVGDHGSAKGALDELEACSPDVAVLDVRLGDSSGIEVCRDIRAAHPEVACLMLTSFGDDEALLDAAMAGASGYVLKQIRSNNLTESIRKIADGVQLLDAAEVRMRLRRFSEAEAGALRSLTPQELKIFELIGEGMSNRQISDEMLLAEKTVKNYASNLFSKLGIDRPTQAAALSARVDERRKHRFN